MDKEYILERKKKDFYRHDGIWNQWIRKPDYRILCISLYKKVFGTVSYGYMEFSEGYY